MSFALLRLDTQSTSQIAQEHRREERNSTICRHACSWLRTGFNCKNLKSGRGRIGVCGMTSQTNELLIISSPTTSSSIQYYHVSKVN